MNSTVSSRTPEGRPNQCPVCGKVLDLEPSTPFGDAPCPHCGVLLWFALHRYFEYESAAPLRERTRRILADHLGLAIDRIPADLQQLDFTALGADSLDVVELVMELEEEFDITLGDDGYEV